MYVCNTNRLTWWALLSTWQPLRREGHLFMPACIEGSPRLMCNPPSSFRYLSHQLPISPSSPSPSPSIATLQVRRTLHPWSGAPRRGSWAGTAGGPPRSHRMREKTWDDRSDRTRFPGNTSAPLHSSSQHKLLETILQGESFIWIYMLSFEKKSK